MPHEVKQIRLPARDSIDLNIVIDGETLEVRPGIVDILRVEAVLDEIGVEKGAPISKQQMPDLIDAMIQHLAVPHTAAVRALGPKSQMRVAGELLRIFNDVIGEPTAPTGEGTETSSDPTGSPAPLRAQLPEPSASPEEPVSRFSMSSSGATDGSEPSSGG